MPVGDFGHAFLRASLVPIAAWCAADAEPSYDLVAALDRDPARNGCNIGKAGLAESPIEFRGRRSGP
jgi:hypothetical protein